MTKRTLLFHPRAKFVSYQHSSEFVDESADLGEGFHHISLYDENIDSNAIQTPRGMIIVHNTYLASFAYNLWLCWAAARRDDDSEAHTLEDRLGHNFKKFYAEQLLHSNNNVFSRAILLETLLYEQQRMIPVFAAKNRDDELHRFSIWASNLMSLATSCHELGHFLLAKRGNHWEELLRSEGPLLSALYGPAQSKYSESFLEEYQCDVIATMSLLSQFEEQYGRQACLRAILFSYAAFAALSSLAKSAKATASEHKKQDLSVDLKSIEKRHLEFSFTLGEDIDASTRAGLVEDLCLAIANRDGLSLFGEDRPLGLPTTIRRDLLSIALKSMESTDLGAREMSLLVAEAFEGHPDGMQYLYLRSKSFTSNRSVPNRIEARGLD